MYVLDAKTGKIVWQFFLVPKAEGDAVRGPEGASPLDNSTLEKWCLALRSAAGETGLLRLFDPASGAPVCARWQSRA